MNKKVVILNKPGKKKLVAPLTRKGEEVEVLGLVLGEMKGDYELEVVVDHGASKASGRVEIRGIAKNGARVKVNGLIKVGERIRQVNSFLEMRILILDNESGAVVEPELEIKANEVKVSHAATVSRVNRSQLFYLAGRGIKKEKAEELIVKGFLSKITDKISLVKGDED